MISHAISRTAFSEIWATTRWAIFSTISTGTATAAASELGTVVSSTLEATSAKDWTGGATTGGGSIRCGAGGGWIGGGWIGGTGGRTAWSGGGVNGRGGGGGGGIGSGTKTGCGGAVLADSGSGA